MLLKLKMKYSSRKAAAHRTLILCKRKCNTITGTDIIVSVASCSRYSKMFSIISTQAYATGVLEVTYVHFRAVPADTLLWQRVLLQEPELQSEESRGCDESVRCR